MTTDKKHWLDYVPDVRVWIVIGLFGLAWRLLYMIEAQPALLNSAPFMTITTLILGGAGLGAPVAFYYGGTKTGSDTMKSQTDALTAAVPAQPDATATTTATVTTSTTETP